MYKTIDKWEFSNWFEQSDTYKNNFTRAGLHALFEYLDEDERDGAGMEFDPIALCCEYTEYESALEGAECYGYVPSCDIPDLTILEPEVEEQQALQYLEERTQVITFDNNTKDGRGVIIQNF